MAIIIIRMAIIILNLIDKTFDDCMNEWMNGTNNRLIKSDRKC